SARDHQIGARIGEAERHGAAETSAAPSDENHLSGQIDDVLLVHPVAESWSCHAVWASLPKPRRDQRSAGAGGARNSARRRIHRAATHHILLCAADRWTFGREDLDE